MARTNRTAEERIAEIDRKIEKHKSDIASLEAKKDAILNPKPRKAKMTTSAVIKIAKEAGLTPEEMLERLKLAITTE